MQKLIWKIAENLRFSMRNEVFCLSSRCEMSTRSSSVYMWCLSTIVCWNNIVVLWHSKAHHGALIEKWKTLWIRQQKKLNQLPVITACIVLLLSFVLYLSQSIIQLNFSCFSSFPNRFADVDPTVDPISQRSKNKQETWKFPHELLDNDHRLIRRRRLVCIF